MKLNQFVRVSALALAAALSAVGCKSTPPLTQLPPDADQKNKGLADVGSEQKVNSDEKTGIKDENLATSDRNFQGWNENGQIFAAYTVHFDYDSSVVKESEKSKLEAVAGKMKNDPTWALKVEGFCD